MTEMVTADEVKAIRVWSLATGKVIQEIDDTTPGQLQSLCVSQDWQWLVGADRSGKIRIWHKQSGQLTRSITCTDVQSLVLSQDSKTVLTCLRDSFTCKIWDLKVHNKTSIVWCPPLVR
jgi:WD40 repeat protein